VNFQEKKRKEFISQLYLNECSIVILVYIISKQTAKNMRQRKEEDDDRYQKQNFEDRIKYSYSSIQTQTDFVSKRNCYNNRDEEKNK